MGCVEDLGYEVLASKVSFKECRTFIEKNCKEIFYVDPGFKIFEKCLIGVPPIAIGLDGPVVILPYTKPCYGTFILRVPSEEDADNVRKNGRKKP
jgi:hypothetical protein